MDYFIYHFFFIKRGEYFRLIIDTSNIDRCRVVYVDKGGFTVCSSDLRQGADTLNEKSIYAVHAAMGLSVSDILLQGCQPIIVEGSNIF